MIPMSAAGSELNSDVNSDVNSATNSATNSTTNSASSKLAGASIMIRFPGTALDAETADFIRTNGIRAVCLFRQNMRDQEQLTRLTADLRAVMGPQALIALDQEGGAVVRAAWVPAPPSAMALGAANDLALAHEVGAAVARAVKALGFNWNFAPVLDLNNNPRNPVIAERSFGAEPVRAAELAQAWMAGSHAEGVACCVKHFPGHGDTHVDSHRALPRVDKSLAELEAFEFASFRRALPDAPAVMTAHIVYPALDQEAPATLSRAILGDLLRGEWAYDGVVITDGMDMHAIAEHYGVGAAAVRALAAGADMVMALGNRATQEETLAALRAAIDDGSLDGAAIQASQQRLARLAAQYPCAGGRYLSEADDRALMARAWARGLSLYCRFGQPQRIARGSKLRLVARADVVSDGVSEAGVSAAVIASSLRRYFELDLVTWSDADAFDWTSLPQDGRIVLLASTARARYGERARNEWRPDLHLCLWNPYQALDIPAPALLTYGFAAPALDAINAWLCGEIVATGSCPVAGFT